VTNSGLARRALARIARRRAIVLGYHGVADARRRDDLSMLLVAPERFRAQVEMLLGAGFRFVTLADFAREAGGSEPPAGLAAITFDDGMRNNHEVAWPILAEYSLPATVYVTIGFIDGSSPWIGAGAAGAMMSERELRELADAGWELGAHTMTHPDMSKLGYEQCLGEIGDSAAALEQISGRAVETFAYPFGRYGPAAVAAARDAGMLAAVTTGSGSWDRYELTRAMVGAADPLAVMLLKLTDRYEPLLSSPPLRAARTASKQLRGRFQARASEAA
jgi:peptidoglycan/xylan/chitin deacetylase (PgdA/CDA1 family)